MGARLQRHVGVGPGGEGARLVQGVNLGVRGAGLLVPAATNDDAVAHDQAADRGVRGGLTQAAPSQGQRRAHMFQVNIGHKTFFATETRRKRREPRQKHKPG
jgi:hypothetical protein